MYQLYGYYLGKLEINEPFDTLIEAQQRKWHYLNHRHSGWKFRIINQQA